MSADFKAKADAFLWTRRDAVLGAVAVGLANAGPTFAQGRDIAKFVVGAAPGGPVEVYARVIAEPMQRLLDQTIIVETKPGANGSIAAQNVADAAPDGKTVWIGTQSMIEINPLVYSGLRWKADDFTVLMKGLEGPIGLVVHPSVPATTFAEFVAWVKRTPGKLSFSTYSAGTSAHFLGAQMNEKFGLDMAHAPYRGSAPQITDLLAGHSLIGFVQAPGVLPHIEAGTLRAIVTTGEKRFPPLPQTPTLVELGYAEFVATVWYGLIVRSNTPPDVQKKILDAAIAAHADAGVRATLAPQGLEMVAKTGDEMRAQVRRASEQWARIVTMTGFKASD